MKMLWDAVGSEFGSRHELYEVNYSGNHEDIRRQALSYLNASSIADDLKVFAESAMAEYDVDGWRAPDLINANKANVIDRKVQSPWVSECRPPALGANSLGVVNKAKSQP